MNRGFTLIELLAVIVVLALLVLLVVPTVTEIIGSSRDNLYNMQIKNIELAAKNWGAENPGLLPEDDGDSVTLFLYNLKMGGFIEDDVTNPLTGDLFPNDMEIEIIKDGNRYEYVVDDESGTPGEEPDYNQIAVMLKGALEDEIEINGGFSGVGPDDVIAYAPDGTRLDSNHISVTVFEDGSVVDNVTDDELGQFEIEYTISYEELTEEVERTVAVVDTIPPEIAFENPLTISASECDGGFDPGDDVLVSDNSGSYDLDINGTVDCNAPTTNTLEYVATDPSGNETVKERTIYVE